MKQMLQIGILGVAVFLLMGASSTTRPVLPECGELLPEGAHYSVTLNGSWDSRKGSARSQISITLKNELTGKAPESIPEEAKPFAQCLRAAIGL